MSDSPLELDELPYLVGRAWTFGDEIGADQILPREHRDQDLALGTFAMRGADPVFARRISRGDIVVAGRDFGIGSTGRAPARALKLAGIACVICRSFDGAFFEAAIHVGLPALKVEETAAIKTGDRLRVDVEGHKVVNLSSGDRYVIRNVYGEHLDILRAGGFAEYVAARS